MKMISPPILRRRQVATLAAASGLAGLAGYGAYRLMSPEAVQPRDPVVAQMLALNLALPSGGVYAMRALQGHRTLVNFWATWCPPCIEELPLINSFYQQNKSNGWQVVGLAIDNAPAVSRFLARMPLDFATPLAGLVGIEWTRKLGNVSGGLPFTVTISAEGEVVYRHMGKLSAEQLDALAQR